MNTVKKIPTVVGLILVVCIVVGVSFILENVLRKPSKASIQLSPENLRITNITDKSFTVSWTTQSQTTGTLSLTSPRKLKSRYFDDRDKTGKLGKYTSHSITIHDATPQTEYRFRIISDGKEHVDNETYKLTTASELPINDAGLDPAYGTIKTSSGDPSLDTLVYVQVNGSQEFSAVTNQAGSWLIPLNQARTEDLTSYLPVVERMDETILARSGDQIASAVTDSLNDSPVPDMQLGKEYDFRKQQAKLSQQSAIADRKLPATIPEKTQPSFPIGGAVLGNTDVKTPQVSISSPKNNSAIVATKPLIQGTGVPGKFVGLSIGSVRPIHASVKIEQNGLWSYTPSRALNEGKQKITITTVDYTGKFISLTHAFTILKSGTQVLGDATPSATLSPTLTTTPQLTNTPTPESTESGTPEPTSSLTGEPPPDTGNAVPTLFILLIGLGLLFGGTFVLSK